MDIKCSQCQKELTDNGKCVGCTLSPKVCTCNNSSEYDTTGTFLEANVTRTSIKWKMIVLVQMKKQNHRTR